MAGKKSVTKTKGSKKSKKPNLDRSSGRSQKAEALRAKQHALEQFWKSSEKKGGVVKLTTGIRGLDQTLQGGIPKGRALLITGGAGSGKTVFLNEFLYRGVTEYDEPGVFITFEERPDDIAKNVRNFGWNYDPLIKNKKLKFVDASPELQRTIDSEGSEWLPAMLVRIRMAVKSVGAKRAVIDNVATIFEKYKNLAEADDIRQTLFLLADELKEMGVTVMMSAEKRKGGNALTKYNVEEYVADGVLDLNVKIGQNQITRELIVRKMRGVGYRSGSVEFDITEDGVEVFPKIPVDNSVATTEFSEKKLFGVPALDKSLNGGVPQGHMIMMAGNTGTGKTTLAMHFLTEGLKNGESVVWVALEESISQVKKTAMEHGWDFEKYEKQGLLNFVSTSLIDISPDRLLYKIVDGVSAKDATRVVVDSVSSMESGTMDKAKVREFLIQLTVFLKTLGVTCIMNYLTSESLSVAGNSLLGTLNTNGMRLSSIVDGVIVLRYMEQERKVEKIMNILKMRGSQHDKDIFNYEITKNGVELCDMEEK